MSRLLAHTDAITRDLEWIKGQAAAVPVTQHSIDDLDERAVQEIDAAQRTVDMVATVSLASTPSRRGITTVLLKAARRGVRVTLLLSAHDLRSPRTMSGIEKLRAQGVHIRIAIHAPSITLLIVDGQTAFIRPTSPDREGLILRNHEACPALAQLAVAYWSRGYVHRPNQLDTGALAMAPQLRQQVLELLVSGEKDATAAKLLGVSLRTFRRYVRQVMDELGANSRFEAGFLAAERGWHTPLSRSHRAHV